MSINEKILGLEIAINNILFVEILERKDEIRSVETSDVGRESTGASEVREELASLDVFHEKVQISFVVECTESVTIPRQHSLVRAEREGKTNRLTMKGCSTAARVLRSELRCST